MKSFSMKKLWTVLGLIGLAHGAIAAEPFGSASLLPMPSVSHSAPVYNHAPTSFGYQDKEAYAPEQAPQQAPGYAPQQAPFAPPPAPVVGEDYKHAMKQSWNEPSCGTGVAAACGRPCPKFFAYGGGLIMGRANQCDTALSQQGVAYNTIMGTNDASQDWSGGFEGGFGYVLPNCCNAISVNYWGLWPSDQSDYVNAVNYANPIRPAMGLNLDQLTYNDGVTSRTVQDWMTTTTGTHYIDRGYNYNSIETNLLGNTQAWGAVPFGAGGLNCNGCVPCGTCGPQRLQFGWLGGVRWFGLDESLRMRTDYNDTVIGQSGDVDELVYGVTTNNSLLGVQFGGQGSYYVTNCWSLYGGGRFGVYNNHITSSQAIYGENGDAVINSGNYAGTGYRFESSKDALATMGQIDFGTRYQLGCHWSLFGGYRVVGISGVATGPSQINQNFADPTYVNKICADDSVVLYGTYLGAQFAW